MTKLKKHEIEQLVDSHFTIDNGYIRNGKVYIEIGREDLINFIDRIYE